MARLNEILVGRFNRIFQKVYGIKGAAPVATLAPEIMPTHPVFSGVELRYIESWNRFGHRVDIGASALNTSAWQLRNPPGSNLLAVVERLEVSSINASGIIVGVASPYAAYANPANGFNLDSRQTSGNGAQVTSQNTAPAVPAFNVFWEVNAAVNALFKLIDTIHQEIVLGPGSSIIAAGTAINTDLNVQVQWRERFLEEGERL